MSGNHKMANCHIFPNIQHPMLHDGPQGTLWGSRAWSRPTNLKISLWGQELQMLKIWTFSGVKYFTNLSVSMIFFLSSASFSLRSILAWYTRIFNQIGVIPKHVLFKTAIFCTVNQCGWRSRRSRYSASWFLHRRRKHDIQSLAYGINYVSRWKL